MKPFFVFICLVVVAFHSTSYGGGGPAVPPYAPGLNPTQSPTQSPLIADPPPRTIEKSASDKDEGISTEIWVAIIGVIGAIGAAFVGAYFQKRKSSK